MITEEEVDKALAWLVENATKAAQARATRLYLEEYRHTVKSLAMKDSGETSAAAQEREAYSSLVYKDHLTSLKQAVFEDEKYRLYYKAAEVKIECYRTYCANLRIQGKLT
jgi:hypothetical protein